MNCQTQDTNIFQRPLWVALLAFTAAFVWGWAYPLIKMGFQELQITPDMTANKIMFAGIRFSISGLIILCIAWFTHRPFRIKNENGSSKTRTLLFILLYCLMNTTLHYVCFYIGLSHAYGARSAILNSMSVFTTVIFACIFFKTDKMTTQKISGCVIGFAGILSLNLGGKESGTFTMMGDGMIILNALCGASASLLTRGLGKRVDVFVGTGYSLAIGGILLLIPASIAGGCLPHVSLWGLMILAFLIGISTIGFSIYNKLLTCNPVGKVAIYNSLIPVIGAVTSCFCLGETFYWKYLIAGALATIGIYIINKGKK